MRVRWGGHLSGVFFRGLTVVFLAAGVAGVCAVSLPHLAGALVFLCAIVIAR